jgi:chromosome segregation ATPase
MMNSELRTWKSKLRGLRQSMQELEDRLPESDIYDDRDEVEEQIEELQLEIDVAIQKIQELEEEENEMSEGVG